MSGDSRRFGGASLIGSFPNSIDVTIIYRPEIKALQPSPKSFSASSRRFNINVLTALNRFVCLSSDK
jgi:hypothetical protein